MDNKYSVNKVFVAACAGLAFFGVAMLSLGALLPPLIQKFPMATALPQIMSVGIILGTIIFGPIVDRFGHKLLLICSSVLMLMGIVGLAYLNNYSLLMLSIFFIGLGGGVLNGQTNALVSDIYGVDKRGKRLSLLGACYCIGALLWTLSCAVIPNYKIPLIGVAIVMLVFIIFFITIQFPRAKDKLVKEKKSVSFISYPWFFVLAFVLFFQSGFEGITGSFSPLYFIKNGVEDSYSTFSLTMFTIGMLVGRLLLGKLMGIFKDSVVLSIYIIIAAFGVIGLYLWPSVIPLIYCAMVLIGFGVGATFPILLNVIGERFSSLSGSAFSIAIFIALLGQFSFNFVLGKLFELDFYFYFPVIMIFTLGVILIVSPFGIKNLRFKNNIKI